VSNSGENKTDESASVGRQPPGFRLRRAREICELSREEVAAHLKLSVEKIESLEHGEVENIAAPVFVAGYLRSYARLVNLSGDDIVADFKKLTAMKSPSMDPATSPAAHDYGQVGNASSLNMSLSGSNDLGGTLIGGAAVVILVVAGYVYFTDSEKISTKKNDNSEMSSEKISSQDKVSKTMSTKLLPKESSPGNEELAKKAARKNIPAPFSASLKEQTNTSVLSELTFYFTEESWVDVKE
jgi:cytoskeletal protein RodZ